MYLSPHLTQTKRINVVPANSCKEVGNSKEGGAQASSGKSNSTVCSLFLTFNSQEMKKEITTGYVFDDNVQPGVPQTRKTIYRGNLFESNDITRKRPMNNDCIVQEVSVCYSPFLKSTMDKDDGDNVDKTLQITNESSSDEKIKDDCGKSDSHLTEYKIHRYAYEADIKTPPVKRKNDLFYNCQPLSARYPITQKTLDDICETWKLRKTEFKDSHLSANKLASHEVSCDGMASNAEDGRISVDSRASTRCLSRCRSHSNSNVSLNCNEPQINQKHDTESITNEMQKTQFSNAHRVSVQMHKENFENIINDRARSNAPPAPRSVKINRIKDIIRNQGNYELKYHGYIQNVTTTTIVDVEPTSIFCPHTRCINQEKNDVCAKNEYACTDKSLSTCKVDIARRRWEEKIKHGTINNAIIKNEEQENGNMATRSDMIHSREVIIKQDEEEESRVEEVVSNVRAKVEEVVTDEEVVKKQSDNILVKEEEEEEVVSTRENIEEEVAIKPEVEEEVKVSERQEEENDEIHEAENNTKHEESVIHSQKAVVDIVASHPEKDNENQLENSTEILKRVEECTTENSTKNQTISLDERTKSLSRILEIEETRSNQNQESDENVQSTTDKDDVRFETVNQHCTYRRTDIEEILYKYKSKNKTFSEIESLGIFNDSNMSYRIGSGESGFNRFCATELRRIRENEKREIGILNDKFVNYIENVRFLEAENKILSSQLNKNCVDSIRNVYMKKVEIAIEYMKSKSARRSDGRIIDGLAEKVDIQKRHLNDMRGKKALNEESIERLVSELAKIEADVLVYKRRINVIDDRIRHVKDDNQKVRTLIEKVRNNIMNERRFKSEYYSKAEEIKFTIHKENDQMSNNSISFDYHVPAKDREMFRVNLQNAIKEIRDVCNRKYEAELQSIEQKYNREISKIDYNRNHSEDRLKTEQKSLVSMRNDLSQKLLDQEVKKTNFMERLKLMKSMSKEASLKFEAELQQKMIYIKNMEKEQDSLTAEIEKLCDNEISLRDEIKKYKSLLNKAGASNEIVHQVTTERTTVVEREHNEEYMGADNRKIKRYYLGTIAIKTVTRDFIELENICKYRTVDLNNMKLVHRSANGYSQEIIIDNNIKLKPKETIKVYSSSSDANLSNQLVMQINAFDTTEYSRTSLFKLDEPLKERCWFTYLN